MSRSKIRHKCIILGCVKMCPGNKERMCWPHVSRLRKYGDPHAGRPIGTIGAGGEILEHIASSNDHGEECIFWPLSTKPGRGGIFYQGRARAPAQAMCIRLYGPCPDPDWGALHSCGNGHLACVNPRHLRWGSRPENFKDAVNHGVAAVGDRHPNAKITAQQALEIREYCGAMSRDELSKIYAVSPKTIGDIRNRRSWKFLKEDENGKAYLGA